jgi:hypothetical protein
MDIDPFSLQCPTFSLQVCTHVCTNGKLLAD